MGFQWFLLSCHLWTYLVALAGKYSLDHALLTTCSMLHAPRASAADPGIEGRQKNPLCKGSPETKLDSGLGIKRMRSDAGARHLNSHVGGRKSACRSFRAQPCQRAMPTHPPPSGWMSMILADSHRNWLLLASSGKVWLHLASSGYLLLALAGSGRI